MWALASVIAGLSQAVRTSIQHSYKDRLTVNAAGFARYVVGLPIAATSLALLAVFSRVNLTAIPPRFWPIVAIGGLGQIGGTWALLTSFQRRSYAIGTIFSKTEVAQTAIISLVFLSESLGFVTWALICVCMVGVAILAGQGVDFRKLRTIDSGAVLGVLAGTGFSVAAVSLRAGSNSISDMPAFHRALITLCAMLTFQVAVNGALTALRSPSDFVALTKVWRGAVLIGVFSVIGSFGWAFGATLANAARVRAVGQVEILAVFAISILAFRARHTRLDYAASLLVMSSVIGVVLTR